VTDGWSDSRCDENSSFDRPAAEKHGRASIQAEQSAALVAVQLAEAAQGRRLGNVSLAPADLAGVEHYAGRTAVANAPLIGSRAW